MGSQLNPYYTRKGVRLFHGDMLNVLEQLPEQCVDMVFADPPYGLSNDGMSVHAGKRVSVNKGDWDRSKGVQGDFAFHQRWMEACKRVLKPNGTLWVSGTYHSIYACGFALQSGGWHILNEISWYKPNAPPHLACRMFAASHETLIWARKSKSAKHKFHYEEMRQTSSDWDFIKRANRQMRSVWGSKDAPCSAWAINTPGPSEKTFGKHPTQKPLELLDRVIQSCTDTGDVVLDPFCGSATTGVSSILLGRMFIGVEKQKEFLDSLAIPRLEEASKSLNGSFLYEPKDTARAPIGGAQRRF